MTEFFNSIFTWFGENKDLIFSTFTIANITGLITAITLLIQTLKGNEDNKKHTMKLSNGLNNLTDVHDAVEYCTEAIDFMSDKLKELQEIQDTNDTNFKNINDKLNAMLDVQQMVYSTINDETIRKGVNNRIIKAKTDETDTIVELKAKLEELQKKLNDTTKALQDELNKTVESLPTAEEKYVEENKIVRA